MGSKMNEEPLIEKFILMKMSSKHVTSVFERYNFLVRVCLAGLKYRLQHDGQRWLKGCTVSLGI